MLVAPTITRKANAPSFTMKRLFSSKEPRRRRSPKVFSLSSAWIYFFLWLSLASTFRNDGSTMIPSGFIPRAFAAASAVDALDEDTDQYGVRTRSPKPFKIESALNSSDKLSLNQILLRAGKRGLGGGIPGALAGVVQVLTLMWLRTIMSYQCRYGTTFAQALATLTREGGVRRLYRGLSFALIQAPLARFVSTAANDGIDALLQSFRWAKNWGPARKTVVASIFVGLCRILLMRKFVLRVRCLFGA